MAATISKLHLNNRLVVGGMTVKISGLRGMLIRMTIARLIFRFGAFVAGTELEMDIT